MFAFVLIQGEASMPHVQRSVHGLVQRGASAALAGRARVPSAPWMIPRFGTEILMADEKEQWNQREAVKATVWLIGFQMELLLSVSL